MAKPILVRIVGDADFSKATKAAGGFGKSIGNVLKGVGIGAGLALADSLAGSFGEALDIGAGTDKLAAQLGVTGAEAEKFGKIAGDLYANAYGESFEDVASVVRDAVTLNIADTDPVTRQVIPPLSVGLRAGHNTYYRPTQPEPAMRIVMLTAGPFGDADHDIPWVKVASTPAQPLVLVGAAIAVLGLLLTLLSRLLFNKQPTDAPA